MPRFRVLLTDYAWPDIEIESAELARVDAELVVAAAADEDSLVRCADGVDAIMTTWAQVTRRVIAAAPQCRVVSRMGIGLDNIDVDFCTQSGIPVTNVPDYCQTEVAEHTLALLLALGRKVALFHLSTKDGIYDLHEGPPLRRLQGQTLGIVGLGAIGVRVAEKAAALGLQVVAATRTARNAPDDVYVVDLETLLQTSDFVSLHVPLTDQTRHLIGPKELRRMKPTAFLINTARGGLVDHDALAQALAAGRIAGAALDVQDAEPPDLSRPPYNDHRVIVTPHAAFASEESIAELRLRAARQTAVGLSGGVPENVVNRVVLPD